MLGRRDLLLQGLAGLGLAACAPLAERRLVTVNLTTPAQAPPAEAPTLLETAFDAAFPRDLPASLPRTSDVPARRSTRIPARAAPFFERKWFLKAARLAKAWSAIVSTTPKPIHSWIPF